MRRIVLTSYRWPLRILVSTAVLQAALEEFDPLRGYKNRLTTIAGSVNLEIVVPPAMRIHSLRGFQV